MNVETRWHHLMDAASDGKVRLAVYTGGDSLRFADEGLFSLTAALELLAEASSLPRFVIEGEALRLLATDQAVMSVSDMLTCGLLHLPYGKCVVEFATNAVHYSVLLREDRLPNGRTGWSASAFGYRGASLNDDAALLFPSRIHLSVEQPDEPPMDTDVRAPRLPEMLYSVEAESFMRDVPSIKAMLEDSHPIAFDRCLTAFLAAMLLPRTIGLRQEGSAVKPSLNRSRRAKSKSDIPPYTLISLGTFVDEGGQTRAVAARGSVAVHLRRAHKRRVAVGVGRSGRQWRFFPAQVVGYLPDGRKPSLPEMLATRAAKPYVMR